MFATNKIGCSCSIETLKVSQQVAEECGETYAIVTYDLGIAKPAMQIQQNETPIFDNVFICFGSFHICLAYLAVLGITWKGLVVPISLLKMTS